MSFVQLADVKALVASGLTDVQLQTVIDREEAAVARCIGALGGTRTVTYRQSDHGTVLRLRRPGRDITVSEAGVTLDASSFTASGRTIARTGTYWQAPIAVTYTPDDAADVTRVVIELVRLAVNQTGFRSEQIAGEYTYQALPSGEREALIQSLLPVAPSLVSRRMSSGYAW